MTLDNLRSSDLLALCKLLNVSSIGTDTFMRFMLRARLESLLKDDMVSFKCQIIITSVSLLLNATKDNRCLQGTDFLLSFISNSSSSQVIQAEGLHTLSPLELQKANSDRGMRSVGVSKERLTLQLEQVLILMLFCN